MSAGGPTAAGGPALDEALQQLLHRWMPQQRWYPAKGRGVGLRDLGAYRWPTSEPDVEVVTHVVGLDSGDRLDVVQVPLSYRPAPLDGAEAALVGVLETPDGPRHVSDATHDPVFVRALLGALAQDPGAEPVPVDAASRVLRGEQSNTSIIVEPATGAPVIVKVFRTLHPGANPDVEVLAALTRVGSANVPALRGWLEGTWRGGADGPDVTDVTGHLAVAVEFLPGSEDAWRVALGAVRAGTDFADEAFELGAATARVHQDLAGAFGTAEVDEAARRRTVSSLQQRLAWARGAVRDLDVHAEALDRHAESLEQLHDLPPVQRVHGDYHLGQVLHAPGRGWVLLDFEGEPLRPLAERTVPDLALRDVAGMLRSIDYAAGHDAVAGSPDGSSSGASGGSGAWAEATRNAFCRGYGSVTGSDPRSHGDLLRALELDKALYEVVYEARNRPTWLRIPLEAVARLLG